MFKFFAKHLLNGIQEVKNNPQIAYTLLLVIIIPLAFLWSGQKFLQAANDNQERIEGESVGLLQDALAISMSDRINDTEYLQKAIEYIKAKDDRKLISELRVVRFENGTPVVAASLAPDEMGKPDTLNREWLDQYSGLIRTTSTMQEVSLRGVRQWVSVRGILDVGGNMVGYIVAVVSMKNIDDLAWAGVLNAYVYFVFIVAFVLILLFRQARIVDYTVLYKKLKEIDQMKDDFLSMAAHELRTPLTIIRGYVELLTGIQNLEDKQKENLRRIDVSAQQLSTLVGDILDVSRLEQGRMKFEFSEIDPNDTVKMMAESFAQVAKDKGLSLVSELAPDLPKIFVDKTRFQQIVTNVLGNAIKYTAKGGVTVKTMFDAAKKTVSIRISDTGFGISAEEQKGLFQKFYRIKNTETESIQGTGLGLWITAKIVAEMKGTVSVESIKGKGSDFIIVFPATEKK